MTDGDPSLAPGYVSLSAESQEQVKLAFESDRNRVADWQFEDVREDLAAHDGIDYTSYLVEISPSNRAQCRNPNCPQEPKKIGKGELRVGCGAQCTEYVSWHYKHW